MCRFIKMEKEGKSVGPVRCRLCHKEGQMAKNCPRLLECTDVDEKGESKKMWHCFNCCQKADHAPVDCPYHVQRWKDDVLRKAYGNLYMNLSWAQVSQYLHYDLFDNDMFLLGSRVLRQKRGVAIGGVLSAQCASLYCMYQGGVLFWHPPTKRCGVGRHCTVLSHSVH